jgi:hypothetical protein
MNIASCIPELFFIQPIGHPIIVSRHLLIEETTLEKVGRNHFSKTLCLAPLLLAISVDCGEKTVL